MFLFRARHICRARGEAWKILRASADFSQRRMWLRERNREDTKADADHSEWWARRHTCRPHGRKTFADIKWYFLLRHGKADCATRGDTLFRNRFRRENQSSEHQFIAAPQIWENHFGSACFMRTLAYIYVNRLKIALTCINAAPPIVTEHTWMGRSQIRAASEYVKNTYSSI